MQCGVETMNDCERSPGRQGLRVNFTEKGEVKERREKFLTAKYGSHQMSLIRKRLAVEMWLYDELQKLYDPPVSQLSKFIANSKTSCRIEKAITEPA
jgi:protein phosphatase 1 regulatory subunit 14B